MKPSESVFVDTGAWVALAVVADPLHIRARESWQVIQEAGVRVVTSLPVVIETFTFLDRRGSRELARLWRKSLDQVPRLRILECSAADLQAAWVFTDAKNFHKLGIVDATSFVAMKKNGIRIAFAFDTHFATAGFRLVEA